MVVLLAIAVALIAGAVVVAVASNKSDKYPDELFNVRWCCQTPVDGGRFPSGRHFNIPSRAVFQTLACELEMPACQIEQMIGAAMVFGENRNDYYKDTKGRTFTVKVEWVRYQKLYGDKRKTSNPLDRGRADCTMKY